jgi:hypothetical protein
MNIHCYWKTMLQDLENYGEPPYLRHIIELQYINHAQSNLRNPPTILILVLFAYLQHLCVQCTWQLVF